jgi:hypothetical protein
MITASILKARGYKNVVDVIGGWRAVEESSIPKTDFVCPTTIPQDTIDNAMTAVY